MVRRLLWLGGATLIPLALLLVMLQPLYSLRSEDELAPNSQTVLINAIYIDGFELSDADEAIAIRNVNSDAINLSGWRLNDGEATSAIFSQGVVLQPGEQLWVTHNGEAFRRQFGFAADLVVPSWPRFANDGDEVYLFDEQDNIVDSVIYGEGRDGNGDWIGPALQPYTAGGLFGKEGQILYRKQDQHSGFPLVDTNTAEDWAQSLADPVNGRRVRYPAWNLDEFFQPLHVTETARITIAIAPDNALATVVAMIDSAQESVEVETLTIENLAIGEALASAARRGLAVRLLLEGSPVGGLPAQEKYVCQRIEEAGGQCWFMIRDDGQRIQDRYRYLHAKFILVDHRQTAISSENLSPNSMPNDDKRDGSWGRRGVVLTTDSPGVVERVHAIFDHDLDPQNHVDLFRWEAGNLKYGSPPPGFRPKTETGGITYTVRYPRPAVFQGQYSFELQQSPENSLRTADGLLHLVNRAGSGDTLLIQQLQERPHWGPTNSSAVSDPNPRLEAYISAARRGAKVRLLLDSFFDDSDSAVSNSATCRRVQHIGRVEYLDISCRLGNPTGLGIHNKMILADVDGQGYVHVGSMNGSELSSKGNREIALLVGSDEAYDLLSEMFEQDMPHDVYFSILLANYRGPAAYPVISEVLYDPIGPDNTEFVEIANPTAQAFDLSAYSLSDASHPEDYEDLRRFPAQTVLMPGQVLVVATSALDFWEEYGSWPDFEILETAAVPNLIDDPNWGDTSTFLRLGNQGDEVILRDNADRIVDALVYGTGVLEGNFPCPLLQASNHSLERVPYWQDTDRCPADFRDWPFPSPGQLP